MPEREAVLANIKEIKRLAKDLQRVRSPEDAAKIISELEAAAVLLDQTITPSLPDQQPSKPRTHLWGNPRMGEYRRDALDMD